MVQAQKAVTSCIKKLDSFLPFCAAITFSKKKFLSFRSLVYLVSVGFSGGKRVNGTAPSNLIKILKMHKLFVSTKC